MIVAILTQSSPSPLPGRSPCPGLNALANHGYLPRDGKDIDHQKVSYATHTAYNFEPGSFDAIVDLVFQFGLSTSSRPNETFHLLDLAQHDFIETDGSLTRNDIFFGDDVHFDPKVWAPYAKDLGLSHYRFTDRFVTVDKAAAATKNRLELAKAVNPRFNASAFQQMAEYGTTGLYLLTMWDDDHEAAPKPWVKSLLCKCNIARLKRKRGEKKKL